MTKDELKDYLIEEAEYNQKDVDSMTPYELISAWLQWNGIVGYTRDIMEVVKASGITRTDYYKSL